MEKRLVPFSIILCYFLTGCNFPEIHHGPKINGDGVVTEEEREVFSFERIKVDGIISVVLIPGEKERVTVEADQNLQPYIHVYNNGKTLIIDTDDSKNFKFTKGNVYVTFVDLSEIKQDGVGSIRSQGAIQTGSLFLDNDGVGSVDLEINCGKLEASLDGVGSIKLSGQTTYFELRNSGVGSVKANHLESDYARIVTTGVGSTEVYAQKEISINSSGVGSVRYRGEAKVINLRSSGVGSVKKVN